MLVKGTVKTGKALTTIILAEHKSEPLKDIIRFMMKKSDNLYADSLFKAMGAASYGAPGTWQKGKKAVDTFLSEKVGLSMKQLQIYDGSGLSHTNKLSPNQLMQLLQWIYLHSEYRNLFIESLPIGGIDGTLRKRMRQSNNKAKIKAKTGNLTGVTALSGYITPKTGLPLIFVIMVNRRNKSAVEFKRKLEDHLCTFLAAHAFS
jgi:D-alanyl-D-alanine carboxypeptidase/D-alanyl-D-alanine-endopeptidase (penicillin-binding protein 4)